MLRNLHILTSLLLLAFIAPLQAQQTYTFTPAGAVGNIGPTQGMVNTEYTGTSLDGDVTVIGGIQYWVVPVTAVYKIETWGGQGYGAFGGRGAYMSGEFALTAGDTLKILPGQMAGDYLNFPSSTYNRQYGGGGGSFVTLTNNTPLVIAGGGGGNHGAAYVTTCDGQITTSGAAGSNASITGNGGTNGNGGEQASSADAGGGLLSNGDGNAGGQAFVNGALGGIDEGTGGFGCGGGTSNFNNYRGGGGGGYSGGGGGNNSSNCCPAAGGGGSFNAGINQDNLAGVNLGDGKIVITALENYADDAGIASILGFTPPVCKGTYPVDVVVQNFGSDQLTTVTVQWTLNGTAQNDFTYTTTIDTVGGVGADTALINLGNVTIDDVTTIKVWTTLPNGNPLDSVAANDTLEIVIAAPVTVSATIVVPLSCNGDADGALIATASAGVTPYNYSWSTGDVVATAANLPTGSYTVMVMDAAGCADTSVIFLPEPAALTTTDATLNVSCNGLTDGEIVLTTSGGTPNYTYAWSNGGTSTTNSNLAAGGYRFTVTDNNGCTFTDSITINEPTALTATATTTDISCNGLGDGEGVVSAQGGTPNYATAWSNGGPSTTSSNLAAGGYSYTVTDNNGCTFTDSVTVNQPSALVLTATITEESTPASGAIDLTVTGGTPAYSFNWNNGSSTEDITGITADTYAVTVTDANGCTDTTSVVVTKVVGIVDVLPQLDCSIYPNPTNGQLTITVDNPKADITIEVLDLLGRKVQNITQANRVTQLNITEKSGVYFVKVTSGSLTHLQRIVVQY